MDKPLTPIEVWNTALALANEDPVDETGEESAADLFRAVYETTVRDALSRHKWSFARKTAKLVQQGETGNRPKYAYPIPADSLLVHKVTLDGAFNGARVRDVEIRGGKILTDVNSSDLYVHYTARAEEPLWAADFMLAMILKFEGIIRKGIHGDIAEGLRLSKEAEDLLLDALTRDRNSQGAQSTSPNAPLIDAWQGNRRRA